MIRFDDALPAMANLVARTLGQDALMSGVVLRDSTGRLAFFSSNELDEATTVQLRNLIELELGAYARSDRPIASIGDFGVSNILSDPAIVTVQGGGCSLRLLDRRLAGADWLRFPSPASAPPSRFVFASIKGGVGRSTALVVTAAELAKQGLRVLVVDLDLEAPGLGAMLLDDGTLPEFGVLDALVENGISGIDDSFLADLVGPSALGGGTGRIDVMPVLGRRSLAHPADVLAKLARAYLEDIRSDGAVASILDQVCSLIDRVADPIRYDVILVDARAGLHETSASALLGLGAEVFLFGLDEPQTYQGFKILLAHLANFVAPGKPAEDWLNRFTIVQGKAPASSDKRAHFVEQCQQVFEDVGLKIRSAEASAAIPVEGSFSDIPWNDDAPDDEVLPREDQNWYEPLAILDDPRFRGFDPRRSPELLSEATYRSSFEQILNQVQSGFRSNSKGSS